MPNARGTGSFTVDGENSCVRLIATAKSDVQRACYLFFAGTRLPAQKDRAKMRADTLDL